MLKPFFPYQIPNELRQEFRISLYETNWTRFFYFSIISFFLMILVILVPDLNAFKNGLAEIYIGYKYFLWIHIGFVVQAVVFWFSYYTVNSQIKNKDTRIEIENILVLLNIFLVLVFVLSLSLISQTIHGAIDSYTVGMMIVASGLLIPLRTLLLLFCPVHFAFIIGILELQTDSKLAWSHISNGSVMLILAIFFNQVFYISKKKDFLKNKTIEAQTRELKNLTDELNKINEEQANDINRTKKLLEQTSLVARIGVWEFDLWKQTGYWSQIAKDIFEVPDNFEANLQSPFCFFKDSRHSYHIAKILQKTIQTGTLLNEEAEIVTEKANSIWIKFTAYSEFENSICKRIYGTFQDITEKKIAERDLIHAKNQAEAANRVKSEFIASISHEIRTPLNSVIGFTDLLMNTELNDCQFHYAKTANYSAQILIELVNDVLDFSKIESGKIKLNSERMNIYELVEQSVEVIRYKAKEKGINIELDIDKNIPQFIQSDPIRLRQIMLNLLSNAIKFTHHGKIEVKIILISWLYPSREIISDANICISVADTGIGISQEDQERIFEAFSQVDTSSNRLNGGTGLGLTITNKLLALMGTKLELESKIGKGSNFHFTLKVKTDINQ